MNNGILLTGGLGTRLLPLTQVVNKHLLGVNGKFVIDYPIETLKKMGCENITVVLGGTHYPQIVGYLGDGSRYGLNFNYVFQNEPKGIAHAIDLCKGSMRNEEKFAVILGDNFFENEVHWEHPHLSLAQITLANHPDLKRFGVASLDDEKGIISIVEKPEELDPNGQHFAMAGCYLFTSRYFEYFKKLTPSPRGEFEIVDIVRQYWQDNQLTYSFVSGLWSDLGTHQSIAFVNNYLYNKSPLSVI